MSEVERRQNIRDALLRFVYDQKVRHSRSETTPTSGLVETHANWSQASISQAELLDAVEYLITDGQLTRNVSTSPPSVARLSITPQGERHVGHSESADLPVRGPAEGAGPAPSTVYNFENAQGVNVASSSPHALQAASNAANGSPAEEATGTRRHRAMLVATWVGSISGVVAVVVALLVWAPWNGKPNTTGEPKTSNQVGINTNNGQVVGGGGGINNYGPPANNDPRAQIVQLTGSWSEDGFHKAIRDRDINLVSLYLKSGMKATTLYQDASVVLYGFQGLPQNGDPVELVKTFQAAGFKVDDELEDSYLMDKLSSQGPRSWLPMPFTSPLAPKGYAGGYGGRFVGSLLFWIVQRSTWVGTSEDNQVMKYLIDQGADCKVPLAFLDYQKMVDIPQYQLMKSCAK